MQWRRQDLVQVGARGTLTLTHHYMKLLVAHKMMQNRPNTLNKVRVAATELPQLLSQNRNMSG